MLESFVDGKIGVLTAFVGRRCPLHPDFPPIGQRNMHIDLEEAAIAMMAAWRLDDDPARGGAPIHFLKPSNPLLDPRV